MIPRASQAATALRSNAPLIAILLLYLLISFLTFDQIEEDAFIYFRLARNIAEGHGYVFNVGGERIESGSGLIWQLLMAAAWHLPLHMIVKAKLLGIAFGMGALLLTHRIASRIISQAGLAYAPPLLLACSAPFFCWSQRGLETASYLFALLLLCAVCCSARWRRLWPWAAFLVAASRPEGFMMLAALAPFLVLQRRRAEPVATGIGLLALLFGLLTLLRLAYFHEPVPHPFYLKASTSVGDGAGRLLGYVIDNGLVLLIIPAALGLARREAWSPARIVVASFALVTGVWSMVGMEGLGPYYRHAAAALPFLFLVCCAGIDELAKDRLTPRAVTVACVAFAIAMLLFSRSSWTLERPTPSVFSHAAIVALRDPLTYGRGIGQILTNPDRFVSNLHAGSPLHTWNAQGLRDPINTGYQATTGKFIRLNYPEGITFVYDQMGQTPWYAGFDKRVIDSYGLLSRAIGHHRFQRRKRLSPVFRAYDAVMAWLAARLWPGEQRRVSAKAAVDGIFEQDPELILINEFGTQFPWNIPSRLSRDPRLDERYTPAYLVNDIVRIYERNDIHSRKRNLAPQGARVKLHPPRRE